MNEELLNTYSEQKERDLVVLLLSSDADSRELGTGFVYLREPKRYWVLTCDHVVRSWAMDDHGDMNAVGLKVVVNDQVGRVAFSGSAMGVDLALIEVKGTIPLTKEIKVREFPPKKRRVFGYGYTHLADGDFVRDPFLGKIGLPISMRRRGSFKNIEAWKIEPTDGSEIKPGQSGSPLFAADSGELAGIISHQRDTHGIAIAGLSILAFLEAAETKLKMKLLPGDPANIATRPRLKKPNPESDDQNNGRFGGMHTRNGRALSARYTLKNKKYFYADFVVRSTDGSTIQPPVFFHLHESYIQPHIKKTKTESGGHEVVLEEVYGEGGYTVGVEVKDKTGKFITLELDLSKDTLLPYALRMR